MSIYQAVKSFLTQPVSNIFRRRKAEKNFARSYAQVTAIGASNTDWIMQGATDAADLKCNIVRLRSRSRDLFKTNPYVRKFRSDLIANVLGAQGITLQMKVKEEEDRVISDPSEERYLRMVQYERRRKEDMARQLNITLANRKYFEELPDRRLVVKAGDPDVYANNLIERAWLRWQRRGNCTVDRSMTYRRFRELRLTMCARDGECFIRLVRGFNNQSKFALQLISAEYCDHELNKVLDNGNEIKMGIEYNSFNEPVAYYFIKRTPQDWLLNYSGGYYSYGAKSYYRIPADEIIHYVNPDDSETGRGAPWISAIIPKVRQLDKYEEAQVVSARAEACKGGHYVPVVDGTNLEDLAERIEQGRDQLTEEVEPGAWKALPYGWEPKPHNPTNPNGNYPEFRKNILRGVAAGLVASHYNTLGNDYEGVNYTSYKAAANDVHEIYMMIQQMDIDIAERPIFEAWLEMALISGDIPLPVSKFEKFNRPKFTARRWSGLEPLKEAAANEKNIKNGLMSRTMILERQGIDFEDVVEELAFEMALMKKAGLHVENNETEKLTPVEISED